MIQRKSSRVGIQTIRAASDPHSTREIRVHFNQRLFHINEFQMTMPGEGDIELIIF
jgi:hypothetical protein